MSVSVQITVKGEDLAPIKCDAAEADVNQVHVEAKTSNTSYGYSGRHDHGVLPELKSTGPMARLVASLEEAKREGDTVLTELMVKEKGEKDEPDAKKPRLEEGGDNEDEIGGEEED
jgi:hypothetical protein